MTIEERLKEYLTGQEERVGFILSDGKIVEVENVAADKKQGFSVKPEDLIKYENEAVASWHTHPGASSNLSMDDYAAFVSWPDWKHYVIGIDGVSCFEVIDGVVVKA